MSGLEQWLVVAGALVLLYVAAVAALLAAGRRVQARALAGFVPDCVVLFSRLLRDRRVPRFRRAALGLLVVYLASPLDLVPDFVPVLGYADDVILVALTTRWLLKACDRKLVEEHWPGPRPALETLLRLAAAG